MKEILQDKKTYLILVVLFMFAFPYLVEQSSYLMTLFAMACIYSISAMSLNLLTGYGGQVSVGNAGFLSVGAYTVAILISKLDLSFWLAFPLAGIVTAIIGLLIGLPAVRLSGHFLAVATLGFGLSIPQIALNWETLTAGYNGMAVKRPSFFSSDLSFFYVIVVSTIFITWLIYNIVKSRMGRTFIAVRDSEIAAQATGINVSFYKTVMFVISAFFTGLAGGLYAYWIGFVSPNDFTIVSSFLLLAMIVVGGLGSIPGAIIGALLFTIIPHFTNTFVGVTNIVIGIAVVLVIFFRPEGIISFKDLLKSVRKNQKKEKTNYKAI